MTTMAAMVMIPVERIHESETNPRSRTKVGLEDLVESIKAHGVLQPVLVRPLSPPDPMYMGNVDPSGTFELVAGHRRIAAARAAGLTEVPATVREMTAEQALELQLIENLQRADLHPLEEAEGYRQLARQPGYDVARIAERVGRSVAYVYDRMKLLSLTKPAQKLFLEGRFAAGHAVLLARLRPEDQARALNPKERGALFMEEHSLLDPQDDEADEHGRDTDPLHGTKPRSVKELQAWIDEYVRFDPAAKDVPDLFPMTAALVKAAADSAEKVVHITRESYVQEGARGGERIIGPRSWKEAQKPCEKAVTGVIVVGPGRGRALKVCIDKGCKVHWAAEQREKAQRAKAVTREGGSGEERARLEAQKRKEAEERQERLRKRWSKAAEAIAGGFAKAIEDLPVDPKSALGKVVIEHCRARVYGFPKSALALVPAGKTAEDLIRHCAYQTLIEDLVSEWRGPEAAAEIKKAFGFDAFTILDKVAPEPTAAEKPAAKPAKAAKPGARARRREKKGA